LFEPPGAAIFAAILLKQSIPLTALIGMGVILFGLGIVVWQSNNATVIDAI